MSEKKRQNRNFDIWWNSSVPFSIYRIADHRVHSARAGHGDHRVSERL